MGGGEVAADECREAGGLESAALSCCIYDYFLAMLKWPDIMALESKLPLLGPTSQCHHLLDQFNQLLLVSLNGSIDFCLRI